MHNEKLFQHISLLAIDLMCQHEPLLDTGSYMPLPPPLTQLCKKKGPPFLSEKDNLGTAS